MQIECASESIIVHISTEGNTDFHGLVYPRGLSKNSSCLQEYRSQPTPITYNLPLRSCNTMPTELVSLFSFSGFLIPDGSRRTTATSFVLSRDQRFISGFFSSRSLIHSRFRHATCAAPHGRAVRAHRAVPGARARTNRVITHYP